MTLPLPATLGHTLWGLIQHELLYLFWSLTDAALLAPLGLLFMGWAYFWPAGEVLLWLWLVMLIPFNLIRLLSALAVDPERQRQVMVLGLLLAVLLAWRTLLYQPASWLDWSWLGDFYDNLATLRGAAFLRDVVLFLLTAVAWWRGIRLATRTFHVDRAGLRLRLGSLLLLPVSFALYYGPHQASVVPFILLFFAAALTALALVRAESIEQAATGRSAVLNPRWLLTIMGVALLMLFCGAAITALVSGQAAGTIFGWLAPGWTALVVGLTAVVATLRYLAGPLIAGLALLIDWLAAVLSTIFARVGFDTSILTTPQNDLAATAEATVEAIEPVTVAAPNLKLLTILIMLSCVLVIALALGRLYQQATLAARDSETVRRGERDRSPNWGQRLLQRLGLWRDWQTAASIRRIYRQMGALAADHGYPRAEFETPYEYQATLEQVWPDYVADSQLITGAYVRVRYGELPETEAELNDIKAAWQRLEKADVDPLDGGSMTLTERL